MKKMLIVAALAAALPGLALAQVANTKHNLSSTNTIPGANKTDATDQVCVFCHTPHAADVSAPVPLWNKKLPTAGSFSTYATLNSSTIDGEILSTGSVSVACLSCHDGTQAMDSVINAPGTGGYNVNGATMGGTWTGTNQTAGRVTGVANLSADLSNDHPIGIEYCGGGITGSGTTVSGSCADVDFKAPNTAMINGSQSFWVDVGTADGNKSKTDVILYTRAFSGGINRPSVECASCHDPHVGGASGDVSFMRVATAGSAICLACHVK